MFVQLYVPPNRNEAGESRDVEDPRNHKASGKPLFKLEYTAPDGSIHPLLVSNVFRIFSS